MRVTILITAMITLLSCAADEPSLRKVAQTPTNNKDSDTSSCANLNLTNALSAADEEFKGVVILRSEDESTQTHCAGVFLAKNKIITAAHCVKNRNLTFLDENIEVSNTEIHPDYIETMKMKNLAILTLKNEVDTDVYPICDFELQEGVRTTLVGFSAGNDDGKLINKQKAFIRPTRLQDDLGMLTNVGKLNSVGGDGENTVLGGNDAGAPLLVQKADKSYCTTAVASKSSARQEVKDEAFSYYSYLQSELNEDFLKASNVHPGKLKAAPELYREQCGD